jgi:hypothetical protein
MENQSLLKQNTFYMPVYQGMFFEEKTQTALRGAFEKLTSSQTESPVRFVRFLFHVVGNNGERCIAEKGASLCPDMRLLNHEPNPEMQSALRDIICAWSMDNLAEESLVAHPFPWFDQDRADRMADRYLSLFWRPEFCVLAQEHIPTFLMGDDLDPLGKYQNRIYRTALASMILPEAESAHAKLQVHARLTQSKEHLDWLWEHIMEDQNEITLIIDDPAHPIQLPG